MLANESPKLAWQEQPVESRVHFFMALSNAHGPARDESRIEAAPVRAKTPPNEICDLSFFLGRRQARRNSIVEVMAIPAALVHWPNLVQATNTR